MSFIGVGAGVLVMLAVLYMQTPLAELSQEGANLMRESFEDMDQSQPELDLSEEDKEVAIEMAGKVAPYMPLGIGLIAALLSAVCGLITVIVMRGRRLPPGPTGFA